MSYHRHDLPASVYTTPRSGTLVADSGIQSVLCFIVAYIIYGHQPQSRIGRRTGSLLRRRSHAILIAAVFYGLAVLNLMWFAGRSGPAWRMRDKTVGARRRRLQCRLGALFLLLIAVVAGLAYSIAGWNHMLTSGLNDFVWQDSC